MDKRSFLKRFAAAASIPLLPGLAMSSPIRRETVFPKGLSGDDLWKAVREDYSLNPDYINLESGYYCMMPNSILRRYHQHVNEVNYYHSYFMRTMMEQERVDIVSGLAAFVGCTPQELVITRNTTESMDTILSGLDWQAGDEVIYAEQEYGSMIAMLKQLASRWGIVLRPLSVPQNPGGDEDILALYRDSITDRTRLILVSHMVNITGQVLPVRAISDMAHRRGVQVLVDGAHAVGHLVFRVDELNCDYYGSSLHKWMSAPLGAGLLYVRREHIPRIWPLLGDGDFPEHDIRKLNHTGTIPFAVNRTIPDAIDWNRKIGVVAKRDRLASLKTYWTAQLRASGSDRFVFQSPSDPARSCAISNVGIAGIDPTILSKKLMHDYGIWTVPVDYAGVRGVRITPNVYTTFEELDAFAEAMMKIAAE